MRNYTINKYLQELASRKPVPGGGSASAFVAALAAGLLEMACNYSSRVKPVLKKITSVRKRLTELIDEDSVYYLSLVKAYRMPKRTPAEVRKRRRAIKDANEKTKKAPREIIKLSNALLHYCDKLKKQANPRLIDDVRCAKVLLKAASKGARNFL